MAASSAVVRSRLLEHAPGHVHVRLDVGQLPEKVLEEGLGLVHELGDSVDRSRKGVQHILVEGKRVVASDGERVGQLTRGPRPAHSG